MSFLQRILLVTVFCVIAALINFGVWTFVSYGYNVADIHPSVRFTAAIMGLAFIAGAAALALHLIREIENE